MPPICFQCLGEHTTQQHALVLRDADAVRRGVRELDDSIRHSDDHTGRALGELQDHISHDLAHSTESIVGAITVAAERTIDVLIWTHEEAMRLAHQQLSVLTGIADMTRNPRATQSDELVRIGTDSFQRQRYADARRVLIDAIEFNPGDYRAYMTLGHTLVEMGDTDEGRQAFESAVAYARNEELQVAALRRVARVSAVLGDATRALTAIETAIRVTPNDPEASYEHVVYLTEATAVGAQAVVATGTRSRSWDESLRVAIAANPDIYRRAADDPALTRVKGEVHKLLRSIASAREAQAREQIEQLVADAAALSELGLVDARAIQSMAARALMDLPSTNFYAALRGSAAATRLRKSLDEAVSTVVGELYLHLKEARRIGSAHGDVRRRSLAVLRERAQEIEKALAAYASESAPPASRAAREWPSKVPDLVTTREMTRTLSQLAADIERDAARGSENGLPTKLGLTAALIVGGIPGGFLLGGVVGWLAGIVIGWPIVVPLLTDPSLGDAMTAGAALGALIGAAAAFFAISVVWDDDPPPRRLATYVVVAGLLPVATMIVLGTWIIPEHDPSCAYSHPNLFIDIGLCIFTDMG